MAVIGISTSAEEVKEEAERKSRYARIVMRTLEDAMPRTRPGSDESAAHLEEIERLKKRAEEGDKMAKLMQTAIECSAAGYTPSNLSTDAIGEAKSRWDAAKKG